jgi:CDP-diacylglycerol--serine O-phosphatidyltransferase
MSITGFSSGDDFYYVLACMFIFFSITTDTLDGWIARKFNQGGNDLGVEIDSLSDCIAFVAAPAILMFCAYGGGLMFIAAGIFTMCGVLRLAWFNIEDTTEGYIGIVTPITASTLVAYFLTNYFYNQILEVGIVEINQFYLPFQPFHDFLINPWTVSIIMLLLGLSNLADFLRYDKRVRKKRGLWKYYIIIAGISVIIMIILMNVAAYTYNNELWAVIYIIVDIWSYCAFYACLAYIVWGFVTWYRLRDE